MSFLSKNLDFLDHPKAAGSGVSEGQTLALHNGCAKRSN